MKQMSFKNLLADDFTAHTSKTTLRVTQQPTTPVLTLTAARQVAATQGRQHRNCKHPSMNNQIYLSKILGVVESS